MFTVEVTRGGGFSIIDHIADLRSTLIREGLHPISLRADRVFQGRIMFSAQFSTPAEAERARLLFAETAVGK